MKSIFFIVLVCFFISKTKCDTLVMSYREAEKLLLEKNLSLIAFQYNINVREALVAQAKLWENPILSIEQGVYDDLTEKWFDITKTGQSVVQIQQLITLAGKRNKNIKLQKELKTLSEIEFAELANTLRFELSKAYYTHHNDLEKVRILEQQINPLQELAKAFYEQYKKGNVAFREVSRLSSLVLSLKSERNSVVNEMLEFQHLIKQLIGLISDDQIITEHYPLLEVDPNLNTQVLFNQAQENRTLLKTYLQKIQVAETNLKLQKSLAVPDLWMGLQYDRAGSYIMDYRALTLSMPLPVYNRNQNLIKIAQFELEMAKSEKKLIEIQIRNDIASTFEKLKNNDKLLIEYQERFDDDFRKLLEAMLYNYQKKNITLTEFVDFYESYKDNLMEYLDTQLKRTLSIEELNYIVGKKIL